MRKRTRVATVVGACALCAVMAGGAAYALAPSFEEAQEEAAEEMVGAQGDEAFSAASISAAKLLELCGLDADGNEIGFASGSPSVTGTQADQGASQGTSAGSASSGWRAMDVPPQASSSAGTLEIFGNVIPYVDAYKAERAPDDTAGLWLGSDSTTDGSWGYFIGHHPGVFNCVMYLNEGDQITVRDGNGDERTYTVFDIYDVPDDTQWSQISSEVTSHGESIVLQTCCGDHQSYRIVQAA